MNQKKEKKPKQNYNEKNEVGELYYNGTVKQWIDWERDSANFPLKALVHFDNQELGKISIDFELLNHKIFEMKDLIFKDRIHYLLKYLRILKPQIGKMAKLELDIISKYQSQIHSLWRNRFRSLYPIFFPLYRIPVGKSELGDFLNLNEDEIFKIIKTYGPIILSHPNIQEKIEEWLGDEDTASVKMTKLKDSLLQYSFGIQIFSKSLKSGRPKSELISKIGDEGVKDFYNILHPYLAFLKKNKSKYTSNEIKSIITKSGKDFVIDLRERQHLDNTRKRRIEFFLSLKDPFHPIGVCLQGDNYLKKEFLDFRWEPNRFARKIMAKLLDVSMSKIEKIIYSQT